MTVAHPPKQVPGRRPPARSPEARTNGGPLGARAESRSTGRIRVLLADSKAMVRGGLVALLGHERDIDVVAELDQPDDVVAEARRLRPDVAVIDLGLISGDLSAARTLRRDVPACRTMILANLATPRALRLAIDAEVRGFVVKDAPPSLLADSIRRIAAGEYVIDSALASRALATPEGPLTERQCEVLGAAAEGASVPEIATRLCLSTGTVRNYLSASIAKLGARNRVDAIRIAQDAGWI